MFIKMLGVCLVFSCTSLPAGAAQSLDQAELERGVGDLFAEKSIDNTTPGCAIGVIEDGKWALRKSYGMANLEYGIPITNQSIFRTGSLSKQFTAAAIALLAEEGKVDLDVDIHAMRTGATSST